MVRRHRTVWLLVTFPGRKESVGKLLTFDLRFLHGIQADETARRLDDFESGPPSPPSWALASSFGFSNRGGIAQGGRESVLSHRCGRDE